MNRFLFLIDVVDNGIFFAARFLQENVFVISGDDRGITASRDVIIFNVLKKCHMLDNIHVQLIFVLSSSPDFYEHDVDFKCERL